MEFLFLNSKGLLVFIPLGFYTDVQEQEERKELQKGYDFLQFIYKTGRKISLIIRTMKIWAEKEIKMLIL